MADQERNPRRRNALLVTGLFAVVVGMVGLSFAAVPLYSLFCRVTGYGGTTQVADGVGDRVLDRTMRIRFTGDVDRALPWRFGPDAHEMTVRVGEPALAHYSAENLAGRPISGTAVYNVNPAKAGQYFMKVQCFCFDQQTLQAGQAVDMPVYFYVDPALADDPDLDDVTTITLSYTFFPASSDDVDGPAEDQYTSVDRTVPAETGNGRSGGG